MWEINNRSWPEVLLASAAIVASAYLILFNKCVGVFDKILAVVVVIGDVCLLLEKSIHSTSGIPVSGILPVTHEGGKSRMNII